MTSAVWGTPSSRCQAHGGTGCGWLRSPFLCPRLGFEPGEPVIVRSEPAKPPGHPLPDHLGVHLPPIGQDDFGHPPPAAVGVPGADRDGLAERQARCRLLGPIAEVLAGLRGVDAPQPDGSPAASGVGRTRLEYPAAAGAARGF